ncbi:chaplin [Streptomyces lincolnensis]|uniref:chaplin n=1 Tax=Streptomyces lincolnensis TaxID=1915 RepID=UPI0037D7EF2C
MRQVTRKGLMTVAAATGVIAATGGAAHADSGAHGSSTNSPGVLSGNSVQAPVHAPVNVCGNTVNVIGVLNPAMGNKCVNSGVETDDGYGGGSGGSHSGGHTGDSPGVGSGNHVEVPVDAPVNVCGNSVDVIGIGNSTTGNDCGNGGGHSSTPPGSQHPGDPGTPEQPGGPVDPAGPPGSPGDPAGPSAPEGGKPGGNQPGTQTVTQPDGGSAQLAHTGSDLPVGLTLPVGAGALLAGVLLYRKARASA